MKTINRNFYFLTEDGKTKRCNDARIVSRIAYDGCVEAVKQDDLCSFVTGGRRELAEFSFVGKEFKSMIPYIVLKRKDTVMYEVTSAVYSVVLDEQIQVTSARLDMRVHQVGKSADEEYVIEQVVDATGVHTRFHLLDAEAEYFRAHPADEELA